MIELPWPPTVNTYYTVSRGRKILSSRGRKYKADCTLLAHGQRTDRFPEGEVSVFIRAYPPDNRKRDIDNILKPVLDVLTAANIYSDDSQVSDLRIQKFNKSAPGRVEIMVSGDEPA